MATYTKFTFKAPKLVTALREKGIRVSSFNGGFSEKSNFTLPSKVSACIFDEYAWGKTLYGSEEMQLPGMLLPTDDSKSLALWLIKHLSGLNIYKISAFEDYNTAYDTDHEDDCYDEDEYEDEYCDDEEEGDYTEEFRKEVKAIIENQYPDGDIREQICLLDDFIEEAEFLYFDYDDGYDFQYEYIEIKNGKMSYRSGIGNDDICDGWYWRNLDEFIALVKNNFQPTTYIRNHNEWVEGDFSDSDTAVSGYVESECNNQAVWIVDYPIIKEIQGTGYEGRNERIEYVNAGDELILKADYNNNYYSPVAIEVFNSKNETLGYLSDGFGSESLAEIAKHLDMIKAKVASVTPLSKRTKRAKYALMDVELYI